MACHTGAVRIQAPRVSALGLVDLADAESADASDPSGTDGCRIEDAVLDGLTRTGVTYRETELVRATVTGSRFTKARFLDVRFDRLDAPDLVASGSTWRDVEIVGSRLGTLGLYESTVSGLRLERCKVGFLGLQGATVQDVLVEDCTIEELDLSDALVSRVAFRDSRVNQLRVRNARLTHVDLREARLDLVDSVEGLRGAVVTFEQLLALAPDLAAALGILVD